MTEEEIGTLPQKQIPGNELSQAVSVEIFIGLMKWALMGIIMHIY